MPSVHNVRQLNIHSVLETRMALDLRRPPLPILPERIHQHHEMRIPHRHQSPGHFPVRSPQRALSPTSGTPIAVSNSKVTPFRATSRHVFNPAPVRITTDSVLLCAHRYAATQRVPFPEISAGDPSALIKRASTSASCAANSHSTPSPPTP